MKKLIILPLCLACACLAFSSATAKTTRAIATESEALVHDGSNGIKLPYRLIKPTTVQSDTKYPLLVFLHGAGERGTNNQAQLAHIQALNLMFEKDAKKDATMVREAFAIFPQCRANSQWVLVPWGEKVPRAQPKEPSADLANVHELIAKLKTTLPIDASRIYVTGISMGGYGTWDYVTRWPEDVAAAIVVCGGASDAELKANPSAARMPLRIFHGSKDGAVPVERARSAFDAICHVNGNANYLEYGAQGHGIWAVAYDEPGLAAWLFNQKKK